MKQRNEIVSSLRIQFARFKLARYGNAEEIFTKYFQKKYWAGGGEETVSGASSTLEYTENIRRAIPELLTRLKVTSILDAPCGDFNWFSQIDLPPGVSYLGADIVAPLIKSNISKFEKANIKFQQLNIVSDKLPETDLWLCRDCLFHLSNADALSAIQNFRSSRTNYLLVTTHTQCKTNRDIPTGYFRELNLELPPFNFPKPLEYIDDWIEGFSERKIGLWRREDLK